MAAGADYATAGELSAYVASANNETDIGIGNRGAALTAACGAASRMIEQFCGRVFWDSDAATARTFSTHDWCTLVTPDFGTVDGLVVQTDEDDDGTFETTWAAGDYQLEPADGVFNGAPGWPYWRLRAIESRTFPTGQRRQIQVTAQWGWAAVPDTITQATLIQAHRLYKRAESPEGVAGFGEFGAVRLQRLDHDVQALLAGYRRDAMLVF